MPRINLKDQDPLPPTPDESGGGTPPVPDGFGEEPSKKTPWLIFAALVLVAAVAVVFLNQKNVIHLWGRKTPRVVEALPEPAPVTTNDSAAMAISAAGGTTPSTTSKANPSTSKAAVEKPSTKTHKETPATVAPPVSQPPKHEPSHPAEVAAPSTGSGAGAFAVQISAWPGKSRADAIAAEISEKGFHAYVIEGLVNGTTWYRVRVGNYGTSKEATSAIAALGEKGYAGGIVVKAEK